MTSVRRALALSFIERYVLIASSLVGNILIARLLSPEQIGLYSVSLAILGIAQVLRDFGVGSYLIQEKDLKEAHIRTAFGILLLLGGTLSVIVFFAAPWAGQFYGEPEMAGTLRICALNFVVLPFCTVSVALLRREMQFQRILYLTLAATVVGFVMTIGLAYAGYGANSMALGTVATNLATGFGAWIAREERILLLPSLSEWRTVMTFGAKGSAANLARNVSGDISEMAFGKVLGFAQVAMLSRASGLMNLVQRDLLAAVVSVAYPAFAQGAREGKDMESQHVASVAAITAVAWPSFGFLAIFSLEVLRLLFGTQWDAAAPLVPWYCLGGAVFAPCFLINPLLTATGNINIATKIELIVQPLRGGFFIGGLMLFPSIDVPPILFAIAAALAAPYYFFMKGKVLANDYGALFRVLLQSGLATVICLIGPVAIVVESSGSEVIGIGWMVAASLICLVSWLVALFVVSHPLSREALVVSFLQRTKAWLGFSAAN